MNHRAIIITENGNVIFRHDENESHIRTLEQNMFHSIIVLNEHKKLNMNKLYNRLKVKLNKIGLSDIKDIIVNKENWQNLKE